MGRNSRQKQTAPPTNPSRRAVIAALGALGVGAAATAAFRQPSSVDAAITALKALPNTDPIPSVFVGHGTPFSAIDPNVWTAEWERIGRALPRPQAILAISAHWLTLDTSLVTAAEKPPMNYDLGGFPREIYEYRYDAPGSPVVAREVTAALEGHVPVVPDHEWGYDHGTWLVLKYMYPKADIPVLQLSIDFRKPPAFHYELATHLRALRSKGVLILGSGNVVHNLRERGGTGVTPTPRDWALEFDKRVTDGVMKGDHQPALNFLSFGEITRNAHPSYDHFLPLLYSLGVATPGGEAQTFCEGFQWPGLGMRGFVLA